ncbi:MFS transporter [Pseudonocardia ailaonensis]|uniref:MFS transporter n=1 Tax=Pseudonocardia ailaonensis TaxID=367279 RepID=A0ABN2N990_9PSEU
MSVPPVRDELFGRSHRSVTIGILLLISLVAFEQLGVGAAMPAVVADLARVEDYAWPFVAFVATTVVGTVLGGRWCDARGPRLVLLLAPAVFGLGLLVAGTAATFPQLLAGRLLQGLGAGAQGVSVYVLIAQVYSERARPAVFGLVSSAYVLPSLVGPPVAGIVTQYLSWHWVFLGLLPLVALAVLLVLPAVRDLSRPQEPALPRRGLVPAALAASAGIAALSWSGQHPTVVGGILAAAALALLVPALRRLAPTGTFRARPGIPAVVAGRGLISGAFFAVTAYLPLMLTATHGWSLTAAGLPLIAGSLGWSAAAAWQGRRPDLSRPMLLRIGMVAVAVGTAGMLAVAPGWGVAWLAVPLWLLAGIGMGLGYSALAALLLAGSTSEDTGYHSSAALLADQLTQATFVGLGGALLALLTSPAVALPVLVAVLAALAVIGALVAPRTAAR